MSRKLTKEITRTLLLMLILFCFFSMPAAAGQIITKQRLVVLDPGHGGNDMGTVTATGLKEKEITLELAQMIQQELADTYRVLLTRSTDIRRLPVERTAFANQNRAVLFISIHLHALQTPKALFFYYDLPMNGINDKETWQHQSIDHKTDSKRMAVLAAGQFQRHKPKFKTEILTAPAIPLEGMLMPGILIEPFSISQIPITALDREAFLTPYANILAKSISLYFRSM